MMDKITLYIWSVAIFCGLHVVATATIFFRLKIMLRKSNLDGYKRILGIHYQRRLQTNGWTKYKWAVGLMVVRASFDNNDELMECEIKPYRFFPVRYKQSLS